MTATGTVWWGNQRVGTLREDQHRLLCFRYDRSWLERGGFAVSISLPVALGEQEQDAHSYFSGLLPEGETRLRVCRQLGLNSDDDAGLLLAIGGDCAGALSVLPDGITPEAEANAAESLSPEDFQQMILTRGARSPYRSERRQRFSLAGAQEKFTIVQDRAGYRLPNAALPSTHLVKFETVPHVCFAEYMATRIAGSLGLPTVAVDYCVLPESAASGQPPQPYLMLERYDRLQDPASGGMQRLHQEDLTQALAYPSSLKYEYEGGPSMADIVTLLRESVDRPVNAVTQLRDWQIFNVLIGNWDGHAKSLALLYQTDSSVPSLAPFYDLVSIEYINRVGGARYAREMALAVGGQYTPERIGIQAWRTFASDLGVPARALLDRVRAMAGALPGHAEQALADFQHRHHRHPVHNELLRMIERRCRWVLQGLG